MQSYLVRKKDFIFNCVNCLSVTSRYRQKLFACTEIEIQQNTEVLVHSCLINLCLSLAVLQRFSGSQSSMRHGTKLGVSPGDTWSQNLL